MTQRLLRLSLAHYRTPTVAEEFGHYFGTALHAKQAARHGTRQYYQVDTLGPSSI